MLCADFRGTLFNEVGGAVSLWTQRVYNRGGGRYEPKSIFADRRGGLWADRSRPCAPNRFQPVIRRSRYFRSDVGKRGRHCYLVAAPEIAAPDADGVRSMLNEVQNALARLPT